MVSDIEDFTVTLSCDGDVREQGKGSNALGSPLKAVGHLIRVIAKQAHASALQSGEMVTTGTLTAALLNEKERHKVIETLKKVLN